ncbi:MAG: hypothetical protein E3J87_04115 [Candidatus Cloacimonadota bacterium]|nr:MAG: hypothetical protein E3J87_04115 [Candidatus Cloacimonadota bacterium]
MKSLFPINGVIEVNHKQMKEQSQSLLSEVYVSDIVNFAERLKTKVKMFQYLLSEVYFYDKK